MLGEALGLRFPIGSATDGSPYGISGPFQGPPFTWNGKTYSGHLGEDWAAPRGTDVYPIAPGVVVKADIYSDWGRVIILSHESLLAGKTIYSMYAHLDSMLVSEGATIIDINRAIGKSGTFGTGPHLHFEIKAYGNAEIRPGKGYTQTQIQDVDCLDFAGIRHFRPSAFVRNPTDACEGQIVFAGSRTGQFDIFVVDPGSGTIAQVTNDSAFDFHPTWSPDHEDIAFGSEREGQRDIWRVELDGSGLRRINNDDVLDQEPSWSPNGLWVTFDHVVDGNEIWRMTTSGTDLQRLTAFPTNDIPLNPSWSPDSQEILYDARVSASPLARELWIMKSDGTNKRQITNTGGSKFGPRMAPNGQTIVFSWLRTGSELDIYVVNRDGSNVRQVTSVSGSEFNPAWSPDGSTIAFTNGAQIFTVRPDGSNLQQVTFENLNAGFHGLDW